MRITPLDIQHMVFKVSLRGYNRQDVDRFLEQIAQTVDELNRETAALREKLGSSEGQLVDSRKAETALTRTLVLTQTMAEELKAAAKRDAELIVKEAEMMASDLLKHARQELATLQHEISDLRKQRVMAIERLRGTLRTFDRALTMEEQDGDSSVGIEPMVDDEPMTGPASR
ncbi:MAG TPA: DivIVA domain-containing protein [Nitrospiraceae bacterium]|jgi:cell division initiation protein